MALLAIPNPHTTSCLYLPLLFASYPIRPVPLVYAIDQKEGSPNAWSVLHLQMSDDDDMVAHDTGDAGASVWYPGEAGQVKKSGHILMKGDKPCKVSQAHTQREPAKPV